MHSPGQVGQLLERLRRQRGREDLPGCTRRRGVSRYGEAR